MTLTKDDLEELAKHLEDKEYNMMMVQAESPSTQGDYSDGHWNGVRYGLRMAADIIRKVTVPDEQS